MRFLVILVIVVAFTGEPAHAQSPAARAPAAPQAYSVDDLVRFAVERHPRLVRATFAVDAARGRFIQAGLYPNPILAVYGDEIGDRTGPKGIWTAPQLTQEFVTGRKLSLSQAIASREVDRSTLGLLSERYAVVGGVRANCYEVLALQTRSELLTELVRLSEEAIELSRKSVVAKQISRLDLLELEVDLEKFRAEAETAIRELAASRRRLAVSIGDPRLVLLRLSGTLVDLPPVYEADQVRDLVLSTHPDVQAARVGAERAGIAVRRAEAERIPNVSVLANFVRQNQNKSNDWGIGVSVPLPLWNRNQGNIRTARAEAGAAIQDIAQVENELANRVTTTFGTYDAARKKAERYRTALLPLAIERHELSLKAFRGGQFEYSKVLKAHRDLAEVRLEYNKALGEAWKAAAELSGLLLIEVWPPTGIPAPPGGLTGSSMTR